jgi:hypothetical protein
VSMKNLLRRATMAAPEPGPQACAYLDPWQAEAGIRMAPRLRADLADGEFRDGLQNGEEK